jgi:RNA polymerase sigma-70 factor (ECF subfamily)
LPLAYIHNERELLERLAEGEEAAFAELMLQVGPSLEIIVMKIVKRPEDVRDILQETFIRIWISRDKLPGLERPAQWLKRVALNETFTWLNKNANRAAVLHMDMEEMQLSENNVVDSMALRETQQLLQKAINQLSPQRKQIYQMSRTQGMKSQEIADALGVSNGYVKNTLSAALDFLRKHLATAGRILLIVVLWQFF